jgi:hypothetical protein
LPGAGFFLTGFIAQKVYFQSNNVALSLKLAHFFGLLVSNQTVNPEKAAWI